MNEEDAKSFYEIVVGEEYDEEFNKWISKVEQYAKSFFTGSGAGDQFTWAELKIISLCIDGAVEEAYKNCENGRHIYNSLDEVLFYTQDDVV